MRNQSSCPVGIVCRVALVALLLPAGARFAKAEVVLSLNPYEGVLWDQFAQHKVNLHTHTTQSDGSMPPATVIDEYRSRGYEVLALTDHNLSTYPWQSYGRDPDALGMVAIAGNELSRHHHTLSLFTNFTTTTTDWDTAIAGVGAAGGLAVISHPAMHWPSWSAEQYSVRAGRRGRCAGQRRRALRRVVQDVPTPGRHRGIQRDATAKRVPAGPRVVGRVCS